MFFVYRFGFFSVSSGLVSVIEAVNFERPNAFEKACTSLPYLAVHVNVGLTAYFH